MYVITLADNNQVLYAGRDGDDIKHTDDLTQALLYKTEEDAWNVAPEGYVVRPKPGQIMSASAEIPASQVTFAKDPAQMLGITVLQIMQSINGALKVADPGTSYDPAGWRINIVALRPAEKQDTGPKLVKP